MRAPVSSNPADLGLADFPCANDQDCLPSSFRNMGNKLSHRVLLRIVLRPASRVRQIASEPCTATTFSGQEFS